MSNELTHNPGRFDEVIHIIDNARSRAMKAVNAELIQMYWSVGAYLSELCSASSFGDKIMRKRTPTSKVSIVAVSIV